MVIHILLLAGGIVTCLCLTVGGGDDDGEGWGGQTLFCPTLPASACRDMSDRFAQIWASISTSKSIKTYFLGRHFDLGYYFKGSGCLREIPQLLLGLKATISSAQQDLPGTHFQRKLLSCLVFMI